MDYKYFGMTSFEKNYYIMLIDDDISCIKYAVANNTYSYVFNIAKNSPSAGRNIIKSYGL